MLYPNGGKYDGEWKDDQRNGQGELVLADGSRGSGEWKDGDLWNGVAEKYFIDGCKEYTGKVENGKRIGIGRGVIDDFGYPPHSYEGELKDGLRDGKGIQIYSDRSKYEGEWKDDKRNGHGIMTWKDGDKYEGEWKDGKRNGKGIHMFSDGDSRGRGKYEGEWKDDKFNGKAL